MTSENRGLFHSLRGISAPAPWSTSCSTSDPGVPSAISHFFPPPPLPVQCFLPFKYVFVEVPQAWWMGSVASCGGSIVEPAVFGTEHALVSSHTGHPCSQHLAMDRPVQGER